jgi:acyl dehydratase
MVTTPPFLTEQLRALTDFTIYPKYTMVPDFGPDAVHRYAFRFSQADVINFARVTGDNNPLHLDAEFAANTPFKRPIIHGMLGASVFTKVLGTEFPGYGSVYLGQTLEFLRPMFVDTDYEAVFTVRSINRDKHMADILGELRDVLTGKVTTRGVATLMHREKI